MKPYMNNGLPWFALYVNFKSEKKVCQELEDQSIESYLPLYTKIKYLKNRKRKTQIPLISCYVFARIPFELRNTILNIQGVVKYVKTDNKPAIIPTSEMDLMRRLTDSNFQFDIEQEDYFMIGEDVDIVHGPLQGLNGKIIERRGRRRLFLRINSIHHAISVEVDNELIEPVSKKPVYSYV